MKRPNTLQTMVSVHHNIDVNVCSCFGE